MKKRIGFFNNHKLVGGRWIPIEYKLVGVDFKNRIKRKTMLDKIKELLK